MKDKKARMIMISNKLICLWENLSFQILRQTLISKVLKLIKGYERNRKKKKDSFQVEIENLFDITKTEEDLLT